ncbi:type I methionyl aminopeptidase [Bartonella sp. HY329]|uniref:type I methionyl aminopeptidase n=1 Tax=unclassified Bartonella TaxID=2645622 RepID=UPI0021C80F47|nr:MULTISPECIES: type I methionyl aminopeptidase [unclassified Bartonella]UXM94183.1 type I methionyl aminopeptidase [Bartonella sp. HY329]UXN08505.1 type I methionyl aminopeptidase [Bartonella sp. HY328]
MLKRKKVPIKGEKEIAKMRVAGALTAKVLTAVSPLIKAGTTTAEIDSFCHNYIINQLHAIPGSLGQYGYPHTVNTSINEVVCHGWPSDRKLVNGDIINVDVTVKKDGFYGDSSVTFIVGDTSEEGQKLIKTTQECLYKAIRLVKPGATLGDIGACIQNHAEKNGYSVVREFCGHGIGSKMHEEPNVLHYGSRGKGLVLQEGMTFTIEPMINQGTEDTITLKDGWTVITADNKLSAQFEHTVLVTQKGVEVLTLRSDEDFKV